MKLISKILLVVIFIFISFESHANRFWVAKDNGNTHYWNDRANWSDRSGGKGGKTIPNNKTKVYFDGKGKGDVTFRTNGFSRRISIGGGYNGTINLNGYNLSIHQNINVGAGTTVEVPSGSRIMVTKFNSTISGTINAENGELRFGKGLVIRASGTLNAPSGSLSIRGDFTNQGTFNHNNGLLVLNTSKNVKLNMGGTGSGKDLYNLTKSGKHTVTLNSNISLNSFTMNTNGGVFRANGKTIYVSKNWTVNTNKYSGFVHQNGTVTFNGTSAQSINTINGKSDFYNVTISNTSGNAVSLSKQIDVKNTLTIDNNATIDIDGKNIEISTLVNNGNFQLEGGETVSISTMDTDSGTVTYDGTGANTELEVGDSYYNLTLNKSAGSIRLDANLDVNGNLTITDGTLYAASSGGTNYNINVAGNWTNSDTFVSGSGTVTFDGTSTITSGGISDDTQDFHNVILSGSSATQNTNAVEVDGDFTISSSGTWDTNGLCIYIEGNTSTGSGTLTNTTLPSLTFSPANSEDDVAIASNITITSNVALRKIDNSEITNSNIDSLITLKENNASGSNINFDATIDSDKKIITINPDSDFSSEQTIYVAIGATVENSCDNAVTASSATFTAVDANIPTLLSSSPSDGATTVGINDNIVLTFSEAVDAESGNIIIKKSSDDSAIETIAVTDAKISGSGSTEITINPATTLDSSTGYYLTIAATAFDDSSSNSYAGINDTTTLNFTTADSCAPTITFSPSDSSTGVASNTNITLTFDEATRNTDDTALTDSNIDSLITLKDTNASGSDIDFDAIIDSDKKIITINPDNDFSSNQTIYVAIGATVEDSSDNAISASSITFTSTTSESAPTITFSPSNNSTSISVDSNITITFSKAIRHLNNSNLTDDNIDSLITLRDTDANGTRILFNATINTVKKIITINPTNDFDSVQTIYIAIGESVEDSFDNAITATSSTFISADTTAPTFVFNPDDLSTEIAVSANLTITFNEAIRNTDDSALTNSNVDSLITLKDSDSSGDDISFDATIDSDKKIITINPDSNFSSEQTIYLAISDGIEDSSDNAITAASISFIAADSDPPDLTFTPLNSATGIAINSDINISFNEAIRNTDDTAVTDSNVDSLITLKDTNASGTDIAFEAIIDDNKQLITIIPNSDFSSEQTIYVAIGATIEDAANNAITASSITFTTADSTAPSVNFVPPDTSTGIPITSDVTLTFDEAVRNVDDSAITNSNVADLITLEYVSDNSPIDFSATIDTDKKVITISPDADFISGEVVFVSIVSVEDSSDNAMGATSGSFSVTDSTAPVVTISPANLSTSVAVDTDITISFDEEIRLINNSTITSSNVDSLITVKDTNSNGSDLAFDATIDSDSKVITIDLSNNLSSEQIVYVSIGATVEDSYNNAISATSSTFTVADNLPPTVVIEAVITRSIAIDSDITFTFTEAVRNLDDSELTNSNVASLITLKDTDQNGIDLTFSATINSAKKIITINPTNNFTSGQIIYAAIGASVEDYSDNLVPASSKTFTAEYLAADLNEPFVEKDLVSLVEAQSEISELFIKDSINPVLDRLEWLRRNKNSENLSLQGIDLNFENDKINELSSIISIPLAAKESINFLPKNMGIWTEGSITLGEINATNISSLKEIRTNGVTIGIDKILDDEMIIGGAIRFGKDHVDIENSRNFINSHNKSVTLYGSKMLNNNTFIDFVMGLSSLKIKQERIHISGSYTGKRYANQYYSSLVYSGKIKKNNLTLSPYGRIDRGYTSLSSYEDKGKTAALRYNKQNVITNTTSIGLLTNYKKNFKHIRINTVARLEYGKEFNKTDDIQVSYLVKNQNYIIKINDQEKNHRRYGVATDINILKKLNVNINYENENIENYGKINIYKINTSYSPTLKSQYNLNLIQNEKNLSSIKLNYSYKITNNWNLKIDNTLNKTNKKYSHNSINFETKINF